MQPYNRLATSVQRSVWSIPVIIGCFICLIPLAVAIVIVLSLIPIYINRQTVPKTSTANTRPLYASYAVQGGDVSSINNLNNIDQTRTTQSFVQGLGISRSNSLQLQGLSKDTISGTNRRKRSIKCDPGTSITSGTGLIFQFNLVYPPDLACQAPSCINTLLNDNYQRFQTATNLSIELAGSIIKLQLCSLGSVFPNATGSNSTSTSQTVTTRNVWLVVTSMSSSRYIPTSTLTSDGNSVVISGSSSIYNFPITSVSMMDTFTENNNSISLTSTKNMLVTRSFHSATGLLSQNVILFSGGINAPDGTKLSNAELFNPSSGTSTLMNMPSIRFDHQSAASTSSNKIVLIGGTDENGTVLTSGNVFDGTTFTSVLNQMKYGRRYHTVTYLPTINKVLIIGGETLNNCTLMILNTIELYNFDSNMFESLDSIRMSTPRSLHTATYIPSPYNQVLIVGGTNNGTNTLNTYEIFSVSTLSLITNGTIQSKRAFHTATLLKNNVDILINGGYSLDEAINVSSQSMAPCEIFNMTTMASTIVANMNVPRASHTAILLPNSGAVLCCGGVNSSNVALASCERYTP